MYVCQYIYNMYLDGVLANVKSTHTLFNIIRLFLLMAL
jgi:hypothetical protein